VNLSDAATKLQTLVSKATETAKDSKAIFQVLTLNQKKNASFCFQLKTKRYRIIMNKLCLCEFTISNVSCNIDFLYMELTNLMK